MKLNGCDGLSMTCRQKEDDYKEVLLEKNERCNARCCYSVFIAKGLCCCWRATPMDADA